MPGRVLFVGTDRSSFDDVLPVLEQDGVFAEWCDPQTADAQVTSWDVVVINASSTRAFRQTAESHPTAHVILSGDGAAEIAAQLQLDYLSEVDDPNVVRVRLRQAIRHRHARLEADLARQSVLRAGGFEALIGTSRPMQELYQLIERAAATTSSVLITGESGTGKELIARALHDRGPRRNQPMVAINCSSVPDALLESELFGHVKGAFTDAKTQRAGLLVKADRGTLFLDEIGDMPLSLQPKLLRALQERSVRPVGGDDEISVDVRVIAATNINLEQAVADKTFREDLYYRLNVIHIPVPALRERPADIPGLALHFAERYAAGMGKTIRGMTPEVSDRLVHYGWPGNVRELQNCIERAVALSRDEEIDVNDLPEKVREYAPSHVLVVSNEPAELITLDELERRYIVQVLERTQGNKKDAARILGIDRKTLYRKLSRYDLSEGGANTSSSSS